MAPLPVRSRWIVHRPVSIIGGDANWRQEAELRPPCRTDEKRSLTAAPWKQIMEDTQEPGVVGDLYDLALGAGSGRLKVNGDDNASRECARADRHPTAWGTRRRSAGLARYMGRHGRR